MDSKRLQKEQHFHDDRFKGDGRRRRSTRKFYSVYTAARNRYVRTISPYCKDAEVLEYGCGTGWESDEWLKRGALLTGIDISPEGIAQAKERIAYSGYDAPYYVMDAENTRFSDGSFDMVIGNAIIHHLDLSRCYRELVRILKSDGHAIFVEPLGHNPLINLYRYLTPQMRTEHEHPLKIRDLRLLRQYFRSVEVHYFSPISLGCGASQKTSNFYHAIRILLQYRQNIFPDSLC